MTTSRRLAAVLTRTLEVKAEQATGVDVSAATFDPGRRTSPSADGIELAGLLHQAHGYAPLRVVDGPAPKVRRRRLVAAVAVSGALALLAAGVTALVGGSTHEPVRVIALGNPPDGWLVPTWVPEGMELWGVDSFSSSGDEQSGEPGTIPQLFGDPDGGRAIYITTFRYEVVPGTAEPVSVRGRSGEAGRGWDVEETDVGDAITWDERGASITALYKGTTRAEAIAVLNALAWRSDDPADGFASPADDSWALRAEVEHWPPDARSARFAYSQGVPPSSSADGRLGLWIYTEASSAVSATYLAGWYEQGPGVGDAERPVTTFDDEWHTLTVAWPDGRSVRIESLGVPQSQLPSRELLERIAHSMTVATEADLGGLRDAAGANVEALPVVASGETRIGTVAIHGEGKFLQLCLARPTGDGTSCRTDALGGSSSTDGSAIATAEWVIDGTWYVVVASRSDDFQIVGGRDATRAPDAGELPAAITRAGEWTIRLVEPPPDIEQVCIDVAGVVSCSHHRPD
jgi:hypothetical protein